MASLGTHAGHATLSHRDSPVFGRGGDMPTDSTRPYLSSNTYFAIPNKRVGYIDAFTYVSNGYKFSHIIMIIISNISFNITIILEFIFANRNYFSLK